MSKILDGTVVENTSDYQFFVQMRKRHFELGTNPGYIFRGGGALIDPFWVLTCAHAFTLAPEEKDTYDVCLCFNNDSQYEQFIDIEDYFLFPKHSKYPGVDAALIKLKSSGTEVGAKTIDLYESILPIEYGQEVRMIGRGHHDTGISLHFNDKLRYVDTKIAHSDMCINGISHNHFDEKYDYCIGEDKVEHTTLTGDSGSPLLIRDLITREFKVLGMVSGNIPLTEYGPDGQFEISKNYSKYTKVPAIFDWIKETIANN